MDSRKLSNRSGPMRQVQRRPPGNATLHCTTGPGLRHCTRVNTDLKTVVVDDLDALQPILARSAPAFEVRIHEIDALPVLETLASRAADVVLAVSMGESYGVGDKKAVFGGCGVHRGGVAGAGWRGCARCCRVSARCGG